MPFHHPIAGTDQGTPGAQERHPAHLNKHAMESTWSPKPQAQQDVASIDQETGW